MSQTSSNNAEDLTAEEIEAGNIQKALKELARGDATATAVENQLTVMEAKIEALLAQAEQEEKERNTASSSSTGSSTGKSAG